MRERLDTDRYFLNMLDAVAAKSRDMHTQVGAIIIGPNNEIRSTGYNELPRRVHHKEERYFRPAKYKWLEHAERNALYNAAREGVRTLDCTVYIPICSCLDCTRGIINSGICRVVIDKARFEGYMSSQSAKHWTDDWDICQEMFNEAGVVLEIK